MKKNINVPFIAFLAWMAALLTLVSIMNTANAQSMVASPQEVSVNLVKQIVIAHVGNTAVDAPCDATWADFEKSERAMEFAYGVLREFTDLSHVEIEIALGAAGYERAMYWAKWSDPMGHMEW
jgi:hypothetical protein